MQQCQYEVRDLFVTSNADVADVDEFKAPVWSVEVHKLALADPGTSSAKTGNQAASEGNGSATDPAKQSYVPQNDLRFVAFVADWSTNWVMSCDAKTPLDLEIGDVIRVGTTEAGYTDYRTVLEKLQVDRLCSAVRQKDNTTGTTDGDKIEMVYVNGKIANMTTRTPTNHDLSDYNMILPSLFFDNFTSTNVLNQIGADEFPINFTRGAAATNVLLRVDPAFNQTEALRPAGVVIAEASAKSNSSSIDPTFRIETDDNGTSTVTVVSGGSGHVASDTFSFVPPLLGAPVGRILTFTITNGVSNSLRRVGTFRLSGTASGNGVGQLFDVTTVADGTSTVAIVDGGSLHLVNDTVQFTAADLGAVVGGITQSDAGHWYNHTDYGRVAGTYRVSGTSNGSGQGQLFVIVVDASATITSLTTEEVGYDHQINDQITIPKEALGGGTSDVIITVSMVTSSPPLNIIVNSVTAPTTLQVRATAVRKSEPESYRLTNEQQFNTDGRATYGDTFSGIQTIDPVYCYRIDAAVDCTSPPTSLRFRHLGDEPLRQASLEGRHQYQMHLDNAYSPLFEVVDVVAHRNHGTPNDRYKAVNSVASGSVVEIQRATGDTETEDAVLNLFPTNPVSRNVHITVVKGGRYSIPPTAVLKTNGVIEVASFEFTVELDKVGRRARLLPFPLFKVVSQNKLTLRFEQPVEMEWLKLVGYTITKAEHSGFATAHEKSQHDWTSLWCDELTGTTLSNHAQAQGALTVLHMGKHREKNDGTSNYHIYDPAGLFTYTETRRRKIDKLSLTLRNHLGGLAHYGQLHMWFKVCTVAA